MFVELARRGSLRAVRCRERCRGRRVVRATAPGASREEVEIRAESVHKHAKAELVFDMEAWQSRDPLALEHEPPPKNLLDDPVVGHPHADGAERREEKQ